MKQTKRILTATIATAMLLTAMTSMAFQKTDGPSPMDVCNRLIISLQTQGINSTCTLIHMNRITGRRISSPPVNVTSKPSSFEMKSNLPFGPEASLTYQCGQPKAITITMKQKRCIWRGSTITTSSSSDATQAVVTKGSLQHGTAGHIAWILP